MRENTDQNCSKYGHFLCTEMVVSVVLVDDSYLQEILMKHVFITWKAQLNYYQI